MTAVITRLQKKSLSSPDEVRTFPKSRVEIFRLGDYTLMRVVFEPGWKWSECMGPTVGTERCEHRHIGYVLQGRCEIVLRDGTSQTLEPGDFFDMPAGHDGLVLGSEPFIALDFLSGETYGR